jgi:hypothetical protein
MSDHTDQTTPTFPGFSKPTYTIVPDELFDNYLPHLTGGELKVLLYIIRRTFGFKKDSDTISLTQIRSGITTKDGRVLDQGTGLSLSTAQLAIKGLIEKGLINATPQSSPERGHEPTLYSLRITGTPYTENRHRAIPEIGKALYRKSVIQETVLQQEGVNSISESQVNINNSENTLDITKHPPTSQEWVIEHCHVSEQDQALTRKLQDAMRPQLTRATYDAWIATLLITDTSHPHVTLAVPSPEAQSWLQGRLKPRIEEALTRLLGFPAKAHFAILAYPAAADIHP